jgi:predicted glycosyltransferase
LKFLASIEHPAHVPIFKIFFEIEKKRHEILITASKKEVSTQLLNTYGFDHTLPYGGDNL